MYLFLSALMRPPVLLLVAVLMALAYLWLNRREERRRLLFLALPLAGLLLCFIPVVGYLALGSLEWDYPPLEERPQDIDAIVVLSGSIHPVDGSGLRFEPGADTLYRCLRAAEIYHEGPPCPVLLSGGKVDPDDPGPTCAEVMRDFFQQQRMGINDNDMILESRSRSTYENAVESCRLLQKRQLTRVLLVTDGTHMRRAVECFRKQGVTVTPCGCRYRATPLRGDVWDYLPQSGVPEEIDDAWHEWLGLAWYRATGKI